MGWVKGSDRNFKALMLVTDDVTGIFCFVFAVVR